MRPNRRHAIFLALTACVVVVFCGIAIAFPATRASNRELRDFVEGQRAEIRAISRRLSDDQKESLRAHITDGYTDEIK